jgi:hypothetical protein
VRQGTSLELDAAHFLSSSIVKIESKMDSKER